MSSYEQFANKTLPVIINVINAQAQELVFQRFLIYGLYGIFIFVGGFLILKRFIKIERRKRT